MILVDTSVWISHFKKSSPDLSALLHSARVCIHPFVIGELSCGNMSNRSEILLLLKSLPQLEAALDEEVFTLIENRKLYSQGLGFIDVHLLTSALIHNVRIWTADKSLNKMAISLGIAMNS